jgi:fructose-bisphosphate aldolase class II
MPLVHATDLIRHAAVHRYALVEIRPRSLGEALDIRAAAESCDAPLLIGVSGEALDGIAIADAMPALEAGLAAARVPASLHYHSVPDRAGLAAAVRIGCNSVTLGAPLAAGCDAAALIALGRSCGIATELAGNDPSTEAKPDFVAHTGHEISPAAIAARRKEHGLPVGLHPDTTPTDVAALAAAGVAKLSVARATGGETAASTFRRLAEAAGTAGRGAAALAQSRIFAPVEHVVAFNAPTLSPPEIDRLFAIGREALGAVPGVRHVRVGRAIAENARYKLCWFIRFANAAVADFYRSEPSHLAFADQHFRPVAADRMTIDFELS